MSALMALASAGSASSAGGASSCRPHPAHGGSHDDPSVHRYQCGFSPIGSVKVSEPGGLGQIARHDDIVAVVERDEGTVALVDVSAPRRPRVVGRYEPGARRALDGDVAFSHDGAFLFYARQTRDWGEEGVHVLDVTDPSDPRRVSYQPHGGTLRVAYFHDGSEEWVFSLDAIDGLVVSRFVRPGLLVPVHVDALPALKVGGPASAGFFVEDEDPQLGVPLLYVTTGRTGLHVLDISDPASPVEVGSWADEGLAAVEVSATKRGRAVYAAPEYWFARNNPSEIVALDARDLGNIAVKSRFRLRPEPDDLWRVQGISRAGPVLFVAHSHAGVLAVGVSGTRFGAVRGATARLGGTRNDGAGVTGSPYAMDVLARGRVVLATDASTGTLSVLRLVP